MSAASESMARRYERAERVIGNNIFDKLLFGTVSPRWLEDSDRFWFAKKGPEGQHFMIVDPDSGTVEPAFDHRRLAELLSAETGSSFNESELPVQRLEPRGEGILVETPVGEWEFENSPYGLQRLAGDQKNRHELRSPDGKWAAFVRDNNLWVRGTDDSDEFAITSDGAADFAYATAPDLIKVPLEFGSIGIVFPPLAIWSPDSSKLFTHRLDQRDVPQLFATQSVTESGRPRLHSWRYPMVGDETIPALEFCVIDVGKRSTTWTKSGPHLASYFASPIFFRRAWWTSDGSHVFLLASSRGDKALTLIKIDPDTGEARELVREESETYVLDAPAHGQPPNVQSIGRGEEVIWWSERTDWGHLYLYDGETGELKNPITIGKWGVRELLCVNKEERTVFFTASGREGGDPYTRHLYRATLDGKTVDRLDEEDADHYVVASPSGSFFLDTYSTVGSPPQTVLRNQLGRIVVELAEANASLLERGGWVWPERFTVKAADGSTDIWGTIFRPSDFDPAKKYPILDDVYPGAHEIRAWPGYGGPQGRRAFDSAPSLAELGFIVVCIDGRGGPLRSKSFRDARNNNSPGSVWLEDHVAALQQLGEKYEYVDIERIGIYGHSHGGWASAHALMKYPQFFKVAVSSAGSHDPRVGWYAISERQYGLELENYGHLNNSSLVSNLEGKLLLVQGDVDHNVGLYVTMQLIHALMKENKDFDLVLIPGGGHGLLGGRGYFIRKRWDYFVRHLLNEEPPAGFRVEEPKLDLSGLI